MYAEAEMLVILKKSWCTDTGEGWFSTSVFLLQTLIFCLPTHPRMQQIQCTGTQVRFSSVRCHTRG